MSAKQKYEQLGYISTGTACQEMGLNRSTFLHRMEQLNIRAINYNENCLRQPPLYWTRENIESAKNFAREAREARAKVA